MLRSCRLWALALGLASMALANDSPSLSSGTFQPMNGEHPQIRMESEDIYLKVYLGSYDVDARFVFTNDGPAQDVTMGFPEWAHDYLRDKANFLNFRSSVDGVPVGVKRFVPAGQHRLDYRAWWLKTVHFSPYQTRMVTVRFSARLDSTPDGDRFHSVGYAFTGGAWKGKVKESRLTVRLPYQGARLGGYARGSEGYRGPGMTRDGRWVYLVRRNWEAEQRFNLVFQDPPDFPRELERVDESSLKGKSAWELTLMRNRIAARYGRPFSDPELRRYFEAQSWYSVDPNYSDRRLRSYECKDMQTIQEYQNKHHLN
ncbi:YARHG domain-containing protein [bacterium]|nr:YARHG domain-containing protein [bacterium]